MTLGLWISFVVISAVHTITPGPTVSLLISSGLRNGGRQTLMLIPGILLGDIMLVCVAFALTTSLVSLSSTLFELIKLVGGAYLVFLGIRTFRDANEPVPSIDTTSAEAARHMRRGFLTAALNPKGILFFATFLPQFITQEGSYGLQFAGLGATFLLVGLTTDTFYAIGSSYGARFMNIRVKRTISQAAAASLFLVGALVLTSTLAALYNSGT